MTEGWILKQIAICDEAIEHLEALPETTYRNLMRSDWEHERRDLQKLLHRKRAKHERREGNQIKDK